jgi:chemotaxis protein CheX
MKIDYINPFNNAVFNAMETMVGIQVSRDKPYLKKDNYTTGDITGIMGMAGKLLAGSVALTFPEKSILQIYEKMIGETATSLSSEVQDMVGELVNIVVGGAKTEFTELGISYQLSIPMVVTGPNHVIKHKFENPIIAIPFKWENNPFTMEISIKLLSGKK